MKFKFIITYFNANMETLTNIRNFSANNEATIQLLSNKQIKKQKQVKTNLNLIIPGKIIIITLINNFDTQMEFLEKLTSFIKPLNMYINSIIINNTYLTVPNIIKMHQLYKNKIKSIFIQYSIIYFYQILKLSQLTFFKKTQTIITLTNYIVNNTLISHIN